MGIYRRIPFPVCILAIILGCAGGKPTQWGHFHGNLANQGIQRVDSGFALSSSWISKPYRITASSPVIGTDYQNREVLYVGTVDGMLVALRAEDGSEKWIKSLSDAGLKTRIVSSPAVSVKRDIYVVSNPTAGPGSTPSMLHKFDQFGSRKWSFTFPDNGFTAGSPKVLSTQTEALIFIYLSVGMIDDLQGALFVLRDEGEQVQLLDSLALGTCRYDSAGSGARLDDHLNFYADSWKLAGAFPPATDENGVVLTDHFIDPTVAVVTGREKPLIAIADNLCSIGAYEWNGADLSVLWRQAHPGVKHSSAAVSDNGLMVFGTREGQVQAHDVETGVKMWEHDAGQPVFATPGLAAEDFVFVVSKDHIQVLDISTGTLANDTKSGSRLPLLGVTHSSPAVAANRVYVSTPEMLTVTHDLKTRGHDTHFHGNGLSSVAIGSDGAVYGVASNGRIYKYAGTE